MKAADRTDPLRARLAVSLVLLAAGNGQGAHAAAADHLFVGEHIVTMEHREDVQTALAVSGDTIVWVGDAEASAAWLGPETQVHELGERALLPGFIDAHGHLTYLAASLGWANLAPPPVGPVDSITRLQSTLAEYIAAHDVPAGSWVIGSGYDDSLLAERRHPDRDDLDAVSRAHPIALLHVSGHLAAVNSAGLAAAGIGAESPDPPGGHIRRRPDSREPNGVLEETATYPVRGVLQQPHGNPLENAAAALNVYAGYGITTAQDGAISGGAINLLETMADQGLLDIDVVIYPIVAGLEQDVTEGRSFGDYRARLKYGGVKLILDGSPQGKTAYLSAPYHVPPAGQDAAYRGYPTHPQPAVDAMISRFHSARVPVLAHANGDAAAQMLIDAVTRAQAADPWDDHRTVMIHAQTVRDDQLDRMAALGMIPSFFSAHTFFWGDWHRDSVLGGQRAARISPTRSSVARNLVFTVHNDAPIVPPDMVRLLWATTNRETRSGKVLGAAQQLSTYEALEAVTRHAAYQYFEEDRKGTLTAGKLADLVVLSRNPLDLPTDALLDLRIVETWSHGRRVHGD